MQSYKKHHDFAKSTFDSVVYKSELVKKSENEFEVTYIDIHEDILGEYERIKEFYQEIGLQR